MDVAFGIQTIVVIKVHILKKNYVKVCFLYMISKIYDATEIQKIEQIAKCFCFYKLQTYHYMGKQYLTEHAIIFLEKSSGLSWNYAYMI